MKSIFVILISIFSQVVFAHTDVGNINYMPPDGIVPDEKTAVVIARPILEKIYGYSTIHDEEPLKASPVNSQIWLVEGTFNHPGSFGGVSMLLIRRRDGAVLGVIHER